MKQSYDRRYTFLICLGLVLLTLVAFEPIRHNGFVGFDDPHYITENPHIKDGITWDSVKWAFTSTYATNWHPLTWLSHMVDYELFGLRPLGHHLMNLLLHIVNTLLLFLVLKSMTRAIWPSVFVAVAFALHPLHVESVAWASERKDVLSTFFWMLTMAAYARYARGPSVGKYILVVLIFAFGLMAKPMLVTLPFVLLLLDGWPLGRIRKAQGIHADNIPKSQTSETGFCESSLGHLIIEKIPLLALVVGSCIVTYTAQQHGGAVSSVESISVKFRIANSLESYVGYINKMFYPGGLAAIYPIMGGVASKSQLIFSLLQLAGISALVVYFRRHGYLAMGWLWYLGSLVPVIGLVQVGFQTMADRYTYIPLIGIFIMVTWGGAEIFTKWHIRKSVVAILISIIVVAMVTGTRRQVGHWQNSLSLFEHALDVTQDNYMAQNSVGVAYAKLGRNSEAINAFKEAIRISPDHVKAYNNMGFVLNKLGRDQEAIGFFKQAISISSSNPEIHFNLGISYSKLGYHSEAIAAFKEAIRVKADYAEAFLNLGIAYGSLRRYQETVDALKEAISIQPDNAKAHYFLGIVYSANDHKDLALEEYRILQNLDSEQAKRLFGRINNN